MTEWTYKNQVEIRNRVLLENDTFETYFDSGTDLNKRVDVCGQLGRLKAWKIEPGEGHDTFSFKVALIGPEGFSNGQYHCQFKGRESPLKVSVETTDGKLAILSHTTG